MMEFLSIQRRKPAYLGRNFAARNVIDIGLNFVIYGRDKGRNKGFDFKIIY